MPKNLRSNIELGIQIIIAIAIVVIAGVVVKRYLFPPTASHFNPARIAVGERLDLPNVDWETNKKTLVFFLMKDCAYCKESAPFYRLLIDAASKRNVKSLAVLPNTIAEGRTYVRSLELAIEDIRTGSLPAYKISGAPTVLFVDRYGIVRSAWFGSAPERDNKMQEELIALFDGEGASVTTR